MGSNGAAVAQPRGRGWDLLLVSLAGFMLTSVARVHQLFPALAVVRPVTVLGLLAIGLCALDRVPQRRVGVWQLPVPQYLVLLLVWMALSVPGALWPGGAFSTLEDFAKTIVIALVIMTAMRAPRDVERLMLVYFAGAVIFAAVVLARMNFQLAVEGRMERLYLYDSNDFATYTVTAMPLGFYFAAAARRLWLRVAAWSGIALLAAGFIWSGSRGGFLAFMAVMAYFLLRYTTVHRSRRWTAAAVVALVVAISAGNEYWTRISTVLHPTHDYNVTDEQGRVPIWRRGVGYMIDHPIFGVGAGNFPRAEGTISPLIERLPRGRNVKWGPPHNSYVQVGAELGVVGLAIFVAMLVTAFRTLSALTRLTGPPGHPSRYQARIAQSLTASLIGFVVGAFFLTLAYHDMVYMLIGMASGLRQVVVNGGAGAAAAAAPVALQQAPPRFARATSSETR